jgi:hypothetical protein
MSPENALPSRFTHGSLHSAVALSWGKYTEESPIVKGFSESSWRKIFDIKG